MYPERLVGPVSMSYLKSVNFNKYILLLGDLPSDSYMTSKYKNIN